MTQNNHWHHEMPFAEALRQTLLQQMEMASRHLEKACSDDLAAAADGVHDARVALRRALTLCQISDPWIDPKWLASRCKARRSMIKALGKARDLDVLSERTIAFFALHSDMDGTSLIAALEKKRRKRHDDLRRQITDKSFQQKLARELMALTREDTALNMVPVPVSDKGDVSMFRLVDCLPVMLYRAAAGLTVFRSVLAADLPAGEPDQMNTWIAEPVLHRLRLAAKDFRHVLLFALPVLDRSAQELIRSFKHMQDVLGDWHDTIVASRIMRDISLDHDSDAAALLWQTEQKNQAARLQQEFHMIWQDMTPAWFHDRITAVLCGFCQQEQGCCASCQAVSAPEPAGAG